MSSPPSRIALASLASGVVLIAIFAALLLLFRAELRDDIHRKIVERAATVLYPEARQQLIDAQAASPGERDPVEILPAVLKTKQQEGMLAVTIFDEEGKTLQSVGPSLLLSELPTEDFPLLLGGELVSHYHADFPLDRYFAGITGPPEQRHMPVLEVLLPLQGRDPVQLLGFVQYYLDARPLALELDAIDARVNRQTLATLGLGAVLIAGVVTVAGLGLRRAQRAIAERNERLTRANFELTLAAKASALGQIASHLIHGLQGSVAGLRAVVANRDPEVAAADDWATAADYTDRIQAMIQETVALLGDTASHTSYELTGHELAEIVRQRSAAAAEKKGVVFTVSGGFDRSLDSHRGGLLCLIASNLVENAIAATAAGRRVAVILRNGGAHASVVVSDEGHGIPDAVRAHLYEPGRTGRPDGTGLGLAISQLLARQIDATLMLESTGPDGTIFRVTVPVED